jgi:hypothetical protein
MSAFSRPVEDDREEPRGDHNERADRCHLPPCKQRIEDHEREGEPCSNDLWVRAQGQTVIEPFRQHEQQPPDQAETEDCHHAEVGSGDGDDVRDACRHEPVTELVGEPAFLAENHGLDDGRTIP